MKLNKHENLRREYSCCSWLDWMAEWVSSWRLNENDTIVRNFLIRQRIHWGGSLCRKLPPCHPAHSHCTSLLFYFLSYCKRWTWSIYSKVHSTLNLYTTRKRRALVRKGGDDDEGRRRGKSQDLWAGLQCDLRACSFGSAISAHSSS